MREQPSGQVVIVDYGMGNLFSVQHAFRTVGMLAVISSSKKDLLSADAVILPGVGAFGNAMDALQRLDLLGPINDFADSAKPLVGICLGMQLLMTEGSEFGRRAGLGLIEGVVEQLPSGRQDGRRIKVPHVGWSRIYSKRPLPVKTDEEVVVPDPWLESPLAGLDEGEFMYFAHSYYVVPENRDMILSMSRYGHVEFCSSVRFHNIFGCQFHPERSGPAGLTIYRNLVSLINHHMHAKR